MSSCRPPARLSLSSPSLPSGWEVFDQSVPAASKEPDTSQVRTRHVLGRPAHKEDRGTGQAPSPSPLLFSSWRHTVSVFNHFAF